MTRFPLGARIAGLTRSVAITCAAILCLVSAGTATAGPLDDGQAAFGRGDWATALSLLRPLADHGDPTAQAYVGTIYLTGQGAPQDIAAAVVLLKKSADQGSADAQFVLGEFYGSGQWGPPDRALALTWLRKAAAQSGAEGAADAQLMLGRFYRDGSSVPQDDAIAAQWFAKAVSGFEYGIQRGDIHSSMVLASMYEAGEGLPRDLRKAETLYASVAKRYRADADRGDVRAQANLAGMYRRGQGVLRDRVQAAGWYRRAADQGDRSAQLALSTLYFGELSPGWIGGFFYQHDNEARVQSYVWMMRALAGMQGSMAAKYASARNLIMADMSPAQIAEANDLIRTWSPVKETPSKDGGIIIPTPAQAAELARLQRELHPTPAQVREAEKDALSYDVTVGSPTAPVTVVEYTSVGCPVCGRWETDVFPAFKAKYVDTGKARFVFREMLVGGAEEVDLATSGFLVARCAGKDSYFAVVDAVFRVQPDIYSGKVDPHSALLKIAESVGMTEAHVETCVSDQGAVQALKARGAVFERYEHVDATPTFEVNGVALSAGFHSLSDLDAAIACVNCASAPTVQPVARSTGPHSLVMRAVDDSGPAGAGAHPPSPGDERVHQVDGGDLWLRPGAVITGDMLKDAWLATNIMDRQAVAFRLTEEGRRRFSAFTTANVGRRFAIVWDGTVLSAPVILQPITGVGGEITGALSAEQAADIVQTITGSRPKAPDNLP
jgi:TPR repeat protein